MRQAPRLLAVARHVERGIHLVCNAAMLVAGLAMLVLLTTVVVLRYIFESSLNSAPDLTELLFAIFVIAGIVQAARKGVHVATQLLLHALPPAGRLALSVFIHAATAGTYLLLAWYAVSNAVIAHDQTSPVLQIPMSVGYGVLATGLALVALCSVTAIAHLLLSGEEIEVDLADAGAGVT